MAHIHGTEEHDCASGEEHSSNTMWGGRYKLGPAEIMEKINASIGFDRRLYAQDIAGSLAHCRHAGRPGHPDGEGRRAPSSAG